jgi:hypothetical protein
LARHREAAANGRESAWGHVVGFSKQNDRHFPICRMGTQNAVARDTKKKPTNMYKIPGSLLLEARKIIQEKWRKQ